MIANIALAVVNFVKQILSWIWGLLGHAAGGTSSAATWAGDKALALTGLKSVWAVIVMSARTPSILVVYGLIALGFYMYGHHEEANAARGIVAAQKDAAAKAAAALVACRNKTAVVAPVAPPTPVAVLPAPATAQPNLGMPAPAPAGTPSVVADGNSPAKATAAHKKKKAASGSPWSLW